MSIWSPRTSQPYLPSPAYIVSPAFVLRQYAMDLYSIHTTIRSYLKRRGAQLLFTKIVAPLGFRDCASFVRRLEATQILC